MLLSSPILLPKPCANSLLSQGRLALSSQGYSAPSLSSPSSRPRGWRGYAGEKGRNLLTLSVSQGLEIEDSEGFLAAWELDLFTSWSGEGMGSSSSQNPKGPVCSLPSCSCSHPQVTGKGTPENEWPGSIGQNTESHLNTLVSVSSG